jgi:hypothetical protein
MSSIVVSGSVASSEPRATKRGFARIAVLTIIAAVIANVLVYFLGDLVIRYDPEFLVLNNPGGIAIFTCAAAVVAVLVYAGLLRYTANPVRTFGIVSAIVLVVTAIPDITYMPSQPGASNAQIALLLLTHLAAAGVIVGILTTLARPSRER